MKRKAGIVLIVLLAVLLAAAALNRDLIVIVWRNVVKVNIEIEEEEWEDGTSYTNVAYAADSENQYLNLYVPHTDSEDVLPLMILVHGGGMMYNDLESEQAHKMYLYFRDHGYACATINYRLSQEAAWPAGIEDVKAAVRFLRANADTYGYDADDFTIWGESAGAYLAVMAAVTDDDEFSGVAFIGEEEQGEISAEVSTLIDFYGCPDYFSEDEQFKELGIPEIVLTIANSWLDQDEMEGFTSAHEYWLRRTLEDISEEEMGTYMPIRYLEQNAQEKAGLQIVIYHGQSDITVPYLQSVEFAEQAEEILGEDQIQLTLFPEYIHADDRFYTDEQLAVLLEQIR